MKKLENTRLSSIMLTNIFKEGSLVSYKGVNYYLNINNERLKELRDEYRFNDHKDFIQFLLENDVIAIVIGNIEILGNMK